MKDTIRAVRIEVGQEPEIVFIEKSLEALQKEVGGLIELVSLDPKIDAFVNEEGLLQGLPFNRYLPTTYGGGRLIPVVGNVIIVSHDAEGDTKGLTEAQAKKLIAKLAEVPPAMFVGV